MRATSTGQIGRFETAWLTSETNLAALTDLSGTWIARMHTRKPQATIVLDIDSSESKTHGAQEGGAYNGHYACTCYYPLFVFNQFGDLQCCILQSGNVYSADGWRELREPVIARYRAKLKRNCFPAQSAPRSVSKTPATFLPIHELLNARYSGYPASTSPDLGNHPGNSG